jgi:hypothetical protein
MKIRSCIPYCGAILALSAPCHAILITLDPLDSDSDVSGTWFQRRLGASSGTWYLPGDFLLEMGLAREGRLPVGENDNIGDGRWENVSFRLTATADRAGGGPFALFYNHADTREDDFQSITTAGSEGRNYTYTFAGTYSPAVDEWSGSFSAKVSRASPVPDAGSTLLLLCGTMAGIHCIRARMA